MAAFQRYAPATLCHATPEPAPSRVLEAGYRRAVKVGAVMRLKGLEAGMLEASRKLPSAMGSPLRDGRPGSSRSPNGCALYSPPHGTARAGGPQERLMEAMETFFCRLPRRWALVPAGHDVPLPRTGIFCWTGTMLQCAWLGTLHSQVTVGSPAVKTGPSKSEILGAILGILEASQRLWHVWQVVGAALAGPVPKRSR